MANSSQRELARRAEARRRARHQARGLPLEADEDPEQTDTDRSPAARSSQQPGFFERLFPPAAPLAGKPDPLAGFNYSGPLGPVVRTGYLLTRSPLIWLAMGIGWAVFNFLQIFAYQYLDNEWLGVISSMLSFVVLIAAGWMGWQRPWAYGLAAAIIGFIAYYGFVLLNILRIPTAETQFNVTQFVVSITLYLIVQAIIGVVAGFYGGYLRRRMSQPQPARNRRRR